MVVPPVLSEDGAGRRGAIRKSRRGEEATGMDSPAAGPCFFSVQLSLGFTSLSPWLKWKLWVTYINCCLFQLNLSDLWHAWLFLISLCFAQPVCIMTSISQALCNHWPGTGTRFPHRALESSDCALPWASERPPSLQSLSTYCSSAICFLPAQHLRLSSPFPLLSPAKDSAGKHQRSAWQQRESHLSGVWRLATFPHIYFFILLGMTVKTNSSCSAWSYSDGNFNWFRGLVEKAGHYLSGRALIWFHLSLYW